MNKEIKSLQGILKGLSSLKGIETENAKKLLKHLLNHILQVTSTTGAFLIKRRKKKFFPIIEAGSYNSQKVMQLLPSISQKLDYTRKKQYIRDKLIYSYEIKQNNHFLIFLKSSPEIDKDKEKIFKLFLPAAAGIIENSEDYKKHIEKEKIAAIGLAANMIIHDFKNPLGAISSITTVIKESTTDEVVIECTDIIQEAVEGLNALTKEILDFSKGKKELERITTSPQELIAGVTELLAERLKENDIIFSVDCLYTESIMADSKKLERALVNLIGNSIEALKGKKQERKINLKVFKYRGKIKFLLSDNGCGIPEDIKEKLFEPFVTKHTVGGTGLGMAIVKQIIESHRGEITFESRPGEGTTFVFTIPIK